MSRIFSNPRPQFRKENGVDVNTNGKLYFREPGANSTTLKTVYSDSALSIPLSNPVILDANGLAPSIFLNGDYNVQETDSSDVQIWRVDNYDPPSVEGQFSDWSSLITYSINDIVRGSDGNYYQSLTSGNLADDPTTSTSSWVKIFFVTEWSSIRAYVVGEYTERSGEQYRALTANTGNDPLTSRSDWEAITISKFDDWISSYSYEVDDIAGGSDGLYYIATFDNTNDDPVSSSSWTQIVFIEEYSNVKTYSEDEIVQSGGSLYRSRINSNVNNYPASSPTEWESLTQTVTSRVKRIAELSTTGTTHGDLVSFTIDGAGYYELYINVLVSRASGTGSVSLSPAWNGTNGDFQFGDIYLNDTLTPTVNADYNFTVGGISPTARVLPTSSSSTVTWRAFVQTFSGTTSLTIRAASNNGSTNFTYSAGGTSGYAKLTETTE